MKLLGKLNASSLKSGDNIRVCGYVTKVTAIAVSGVNVTVQTEMFEDVTYFCGDKVSLFSKY